MGQVLAACSDVGPRGVDEHEVFFSDSEAETPPTTTTPNDTPPSTHEAPPKEWERAPTLNFESRKNKSEFWDPGYYHAQVNKSRDHLPGYYDSRTEPVHVHYHYKADPVYVAYRKWRAQLDNTRKAHLFAGSPLEEENEDRCGPWGLPAFEKYCRIPELDPLWDCVDKKNPFAEKFFAYEVDADGKAKQVRPRWFLGFVRTCC